MKDKLRKIIDNEHLDSYSLFELKNSGLIIKITYSQYVITEKGFRLLMRKPVRKQELSKLILQN